MNNYSVFCDNCSYKKTIKKSEDLKDFIIIKSAPVQKNIPQMDYVSNVFKPSNDLTLPKKVRCPKCGFAIRPKLIKEEKK